MPALKKPSAVLLALGAVAAPEAPATPATPAVPTVEVPVLRGIEEVIAPDARITSLREAAVVEVALL